MEAPPEGRGTTVQVCGLFPWAVGGLSPTVGVPLGRNLVGGGTVCCDPLYWFERARLILNPSQFVLGLPALGKSTLIRRQVIGLAGAGVVPLILGDIRPDYAATVRALGGQVIKLGRGLGSLNVLDVGALDAAADRLPGRDGARLREEAHGRRLNMVSALVVFARGAPVIRALAKGRALVWVTGAKVAMVTTLPWYQGARAGEIEAAHRAAERDLTGAAHPDPRPHDGGTPDDGTPSNDTPEAA